VHCDSVHPLDRPGNLDDVSVCAVTKPSPTSARKTLQIQLELYNPDTDESVTVICLVDTGAEISVFMITALPAHTQLRESKARISGAFAGSKADNRVYRASVGVRRQGIQYPLLHGYAMTNLAKHRVVLGMAWLRSAQAQICLYPNPAIEKLLIRGTGPRGVNKHYEWECLTLDPRTVGTAVHVVTDSSASHYDTTSFVGEDTISKASQQSVAIACDELPVVPILGPCNFQGGGY
jgi:hypothetical protein